MKKSIIIAVFALAGAPVFAAKKVDALVICESDVVRSSSYSDPYPGGLKEAIRKLNIRLNSDQITAGAYSQDELTIEKPFSVSAPTILRSERNSDYLDVCVTLTKK